jgi:hypothetical protein
MVVVGNDGSELAARCFARRVSNVLSRARSFSETPAIRAATAGS